MPFTPFPGDPVSLVAAEAQVVREQAGTRKSETAEDRLAEANACAQILRVQVQYLNGEIDQLRHKIAVMQSRHPCLRLTKAQAKALDALCGPHGSRFTDKMLARKIGTTNATASAYLRWAYALLGVRTRKEAAKTWPSLRPLWVKAHGEPT